MDKEKQLKELLEVKSAAEQVIARIDQAISSLDSAKSWEIWDLLGGGLFTSLMKRNKIQNVNENIDSIRNSLNKLNCELEDVNMKLSSEISNMLSDNFFDVCSTIFLRISEFKEK